MIKNTSAWSINHVQLFNFATLLPYFKIWLFKSITLIVADNLILNLSLYSQILFYHDKRDIKLLAVLAHLSKNIKNATEYKIFSDIKASDDRPPQKWQSVHKVSLTTFYSYDLPLYLYEYDLT